MDKASHIDEWIPTECIPHFWIWIDRAVWGVENAVSSSLTLRIRDAVPTDGEEDGAIGSGITRPETRSEVTDEALMTLICNGDKESLALLFRRYGRIVRGIAYRVLRDESEADDLVQDFFVLINEKSGMFDSARGSARAWILEISYRLALHRRRSLNSHHFYTRVDLDDLGDKLNTVESGVTVRDSEDGLLDRIGLRRIFEGLTENQRDTLRLFFEEGHTLPEIAQKLNQTRANVKNHYFRGLEKLRKEFFGDKLRGGSAV